ncbi:MAG TPA: hypothetical protein PKH33_01025 [bacterium]|nr:hypothetical protein [bacterium]
MRIKDRVISEIERMTEERLGAVLKFIISLEKESAAPGTAGETKWGILALESGAFDFWRNPEEVEYAIDDLKERK